MEPSFRRALPADLDRLLELMAEFYAGEAYSFDPTAARAAAGRLLADPSIGRVWIASDGDAEVGYLVLTLGWSLELHGRDAFIDEIFVGPSHRGRGIGARALSVAEEACAEIGVKALHLEVEHRNESANALYRRQGFLDHDRALMTKSIARARSGRPGAVVEFHYSIGSRYSYLASTQVASLERDTGCRIEWRPIDGTALLARRGASPFEGSAVSGQYEWPYRETDAKRWAKLYGVPFIEPRGRVTFDSRTLALAATAAAAFGDTETFSRELFSAMFVEPLERIDEEECVRRAERCGIGADAFRAAIRSDETAASLETTLAGAIRAGVFGVPTFVVGGRIFWGNDRIALLRHDLLES